MKVPTTIAESDDAEEIERWMVIYKKGCPKTEIWITSSPLGERTWRKYIPTRRMGPYSFHMDKNGLQIWDERL